MEFIRFKTLKHCLMIKSNFLARKNLYYNLILKTLFQFIISLSTFTRKGKDPDPQPYRHLTDPEGPKTYGSGKLVINRSPFFLVTCFLDSHIILSFFPHSPRK